MVTAKRRKTDSSNAMPTVFLFNQTSLAITKSITTHKVRISLRKLHQNKKDGLVPSFLFCGAVAPLKY